MAAKPYFRVVSHPLDSQPRHRAVWTLMGRDVAVQIWPESEWAQLHPGERPPEAAFVPGVGWLALHTVGEDEADEIADERAASAQEWERRKARHR